MQYVRPSSMTLGQWDAGADWASPTALEFEQETLHAETFGLQHVISSEAEIPPAALVRQIERMYHEVRAGLDESGRVVDATETVGIRLCPDPTPFAPAVAMRIQAKTWPAMPGVTTAARPVPEMPRRW